MFSSSSSSSSSSMISSSSITISKLLLVLSSSTTTIMISSIITIIIIDTITIRKSKSAMCFKLSWLSISTLKQKSCKQKANSATNIAPY